MSPQLLVHKPHTCGGHLSIPRSNLPSFVNKTHKTLEFLHLRPDLLPKPERASHPQAPWPHTRKCYFSSQLLYTRLQTTPVCAEGPGLMEPIDQHRVPVSSYIQWRNERVIVSAWFYSLFLKKNISEPQSHFSSVQICGFFWWPSSCLVSLTPSRSSLSLTSHEEERAVN